MKKNKIKLDDIVNILKVQEVSSPFRMVETPPKTDEKNSATEKEFKASMDPHTRFIPKPADDISIGKRLFTDLPSDSGN